MPPTSRVQCQYPYADTRQHSPQIARPPDDHHDHPYEMTPEDTTTADTTNRPTTDETGLDTPDETGHDRTTPDSTTADRTRTDRATTDSSPRTAPGRTPLTEAAGPPLVPTFPTATDHTDDLLPTAVEGNRHSTRPTTADRDAPLVPDLRSVRRTEPDGGAE